jgi:hypothetical protein
MNPVVWLTIWLLTILIVYCLWWPGAAVNLRHWVAMKILDLNWQIIKLAYWVEHRELRGDPPVREPE